MDHRLLEGGNVFKDAQGQPRTQRINLADIAATVQWLESVTGLPLSDNMLGSTGQKPTSGDLDLAVDSNRVNKDDLVRQLSDYVTRNGQEPRDWVRKSGTAVHFLTPISGRADTGFVQTDFMFLPKPDFSKFILRQDPDSAYKGATRNVLMNSLAKSMGYKLNQIAGIADRTTNDIISDDPDKIAKLLLNPQATRADLGSVERIMAALKSDPRRDAKLADFRDHMAREGTPIDESRDNDVNFLARLRDRIVNQGMSPLIESNVVTEAQAAAVGGKAKGIEHLEDLVFRSGITGVQQALAIVNDFYRDPSTGSVKWDGKPAVIWGRKPSTGEFVVTDGSGFEARGYDGLFTSPNQLRTNLAQRDAAAQERGNVANRVQSLYPIYQRLWPYLEQSLPDNFRGYVKGDLLYSERPPEVSGAFEFTPNTVRYRIPASSELGEKIANSDIGIAVHTMYADQGESKQPLSRVKFNSVPGLALMEPIYAQSVKPNQALIRDIRKVSNSAPGRAISLLFNPAELRQQQISDLPKLAIDYINRRIDPRSDFYTGDYQDLMPGFLRWLEQNVTPRKYANILEYLRSPSSNLGALNSAFVLFELLHNLKVDIQTQLDRQVPGNEGWVMATPSGYAKTVNRFDFTQQNRQRNNP